MPDIDNLWDEALPSDASLAARGRQEIVNAWQAIQFGLTDTLEFPGGLLKDGASRTFVGSNSLCTYAAGDDSKLANRMYFLSAESRLVYFDTDVIFSRGTLLLGSPYRATHAGTPQNPNESRTYWASLSGQSFVLAATVAADMKYTMNGLANDGTTPYHKALWAEDPTIIVNSSSTNETFVASSATTGSWALAKTSTDAGSDATIYWIATGPLWITHGGGSNNHKMF